MREIVPIPMPADDAPRPYLRTWRERLFTWPWRPWRKWEDGPSWKEIMEETQRMIDEVSGATDMMRFFGGEKPEAAFK